jgi:hypothetical protein
MTDDERLRAIRERCERATPKRHEGEVIVCETVPWPKDVAASQADVPWLLARLDALEADLAKERSHVTGLLGGLEFAAEALLNAPPDDRLKKRAEALEALCSRQREALRAVPDLLRFTLLHHAETCRLRVGDQWECSCGVGPARRLIEEVSKEPIP